MWQLNYCFFSSALTFGFDPSVYSVMEGESEVVTVTVMGGGILERDVVLTVTSSDGTAGTVVVGHENGVDCVCNVKVHSTSFSVSLPATHSR